MSVWSTREKQRNNKSLLPTVQSGNSLEEKENYEFPHALIVEDREKGRKRIGEKKT